VMDISTGTDDVDVKLRFPKGVAAVADECMSEWMEYVYLQHMDPSDIKGVDVFIKVLDPNGDYYSDIVTIDRNGVFSHSWAPEIVGDYHVTVMFEGSESYYTSEATTTFTVDQTPATYAVPPTADEIAQKTINMLPAYSTIDLVIIAAVAIAIIIGLYAIIKKQK